ncbi:hypothetical protein DRJ25_03185 [Candidatus Woesearchaeota archaeon]|nr:MAG: hypothetical protein DRJ25_03185 [Candidatus Woesearchaeota archaeon]
MNETNNNRMKDEITLVKEFQERLPKFPDGRVNYSDSEIAPVVTLLVKCCEKYLLLKRSQKVSSYKGKWANIGGYIDRPITAKEIALKELEEETGITADKVTSIKKGEAIEYHDGQTNKTWIVFPFLAELEKIPEIRLDWEHERYVWISPEEIKEFDIVPDIDKYFSYKFS